MLIDASKRNDFPTDFVIFKKASFTNRLTDGPTDGPTNGTTDGLTYPLIEMR